MIVANVAIADMWSYGGPGKTVLGDFGLVNVIIGKNNAGKSNLLRSLKWACDVARLPDRKKQCYTCDTNWIHNSGALRRDKTPHLRCTFQISTHDWPKEKLPKWMARLQALESEERLNALFTLSLDGDESPYRITEDFKWNDIERTSQLLASNGTDLSQASHLLVPLARELISSKIVMLDGWRQLTDAVKEKQNYVACIHQLRKSPNATQRDSELYQNIRAFFQELTGTQDIELYPRQGKTDFNITIGGKTLPLSQYGDGIQHLLMVAIKAAMNPRGVFLVEEPETHLHPHLQRQLLWFLADRLKSQVFVTTHSPVFLDSKKANRILRVTNDLSSEVKVVEAPMDYFEVLDDIGARASDILQANVVVWVEGPSDRILIRRAVSIVDGDLQEGVHFQIACYGGALRKYCAFGDDSTDVVNLMRLGRHVAMICDRDGVSSNAQINAEKARLRKQCMESNGYYWVTEGREIENYLRDTVLSRAFGSVVPGGKLVVKLKDNQRLDDALKALAVRRKIGRNRWLHYAQHKPEIMAMIVKSITEEADLKRLDFLRRIQELAKFIRDRNTLNSVRSRA
jgi:predicted ATP-dependent endonuclease of OLD family